MCGIICFSKTKDYSFQELTSLCQSIVHRGPDHSSISDFLIDNKSKIYLLATQLMIVGKETFPIEFGHSNNKSELDTDIMIGNIEIYNYKELYETYLIDDFSWDSNYSDTHVLIPLFRKFIQQGLGKIEAIEKTLSLIKGEYAFAMLLSSLELLIARDPIGIRPLYFVFENEKSFAFASEVHSIVSLDFTNNLIQAVHPGYFTLLDLNHQCSDLHWHEITDNLQYICENRNFNYFSEGVSKEILSRELLTILENSFKIRIPTNQYALFISGGIDSSILLGLLLKIGDVKKCFIISVGFEGSPDLETARSLCNSLKVPLYEVIITKISLKSELPCILKNLRLRSSVISPIDVSIAVPIHFASKKAKEFGCKVAMSGQGADELFIGYKKYFDSELKTNAEKLLNKVNHDIINIASQNLERDDIITMNSSIEVRFPYLDIEVLRWVMNQNVSTLYTASETNRKEILRNVAAKLNLPDFIVNRQKKAAQYGTYVMKNLYQLAKQHESINDYLESI